jgi:hypothetical protein
VHCVIGVSTGGTKVMTVNDLCFNANIDNLNFFELRSYLDQSLLSRKLKGLVSIQDSFELLFTQMLLSLQALLRNKQQWN